jgi:signal transduction histidine kinase
MLAAILIGTILVAAVGARRVTRPLAALAARTAEIGRGMLAGRVEPSGAREIAGLGDSINRMSEELATLQDEIRTRERLSAFARFGAGLVHDLGTPIKALQMNAMLAVESPDDSVRQEAVRRLLSEQKVIERYLQLVRSYARGERIGLRPVLVSAEGFLAQVAMRARARWNQVSVEVAPIPNPVYLYIDPGFIERVLENLAKNAVEAMARSDVRRIELGAEPLAEGETQLWIRDSGCGIDADRIATLFEPFRSSKESGLGVGLALSRWLVEESGGRMSCDSEVGRGTTFKMIFPARPPATDEAEQRV